MKTLILVLLLVSSQAQGYLVKGAGTADCGKFLSDTQTGSKANREDWKLNYVRWALGYITGRNYEADSTNGKGVSLDAIADSIVKYCQDNPLDKVSHAMKDIYPTLE